MDRKTLGLGLLNASFFVLVACSSTDKKMADTNESALSRKPSNTQKECIFPISEIKTFAKPPSSNERSDWIAEICRREGKRLAAQCNLGVPAGELKRTCTGSESPIAVNANSPLLPEGPTPFNESRNFALKGKSENEVQLKTQELSQRELPKLSKLMSEFSEKCRAQGGLAVAFIDTKQNLVPPDQDEEMEFVSNLKIRAFGSCHQKGEGQVKEYEAQLEVRFWL